MDSRKDNLIVIANLNWKFSWKNREFNIENPYSICRFKKKSLWWCVQRKSIRSGLHI